MQLEPWIETFSGKKMYFLDPSPDMIDIEDISHSLSLQCRFAGHTKKFYSVAEHSYRVGTWLWQRFGDASTALQGILHDASEAYLIDIPSPVKAHLNNYGEIEGRLMRRINEKFGVPYPYNDKVKLADMVMLKNEALHLMHSKGEPWAYKFDTQDHSERLSPLCHSPEEAKRVFMVWFNYLKERSDEQKEKVNNGTSERDQRQQREEQLFGATLRDLGSASFSY
ncbi:MAG: phosphohydrolase [Nitrosotalea sp.]